MSKNTNFFKVALFENEPVRGDWHKNEWYLSVVDIIKVLTGSPNPRRYWSDLKIKLQNEGSQLYAKIVQLKLASSDGKKYDTDCTTVSDTLRLIQSIPSPKAEPFKMWLAQLGKERIDEIQDPELAVTRAKEIYTRKGYPKSWIDKRLRGINVRNTLTDEWRERGVKAQNEFAILTDEIYKGAFEMNAKEYKGFKSLDRENNLRDHMNDMELILTMLGEATTTELTKARDSKELPGLKVDASDGGAVAGRTRKDIETQTRKKVTSRKNFLNEKGIDKLLVQKTRTEVNPRAHHYAG